MTTLTPPALHIPEPHLEFVTEIRVQLDSIHVIGPSSHGLRRVVPILGGVMEGPQLNGRVLSGGADWQFVRPDGVLELEAKYTLETHDGVLIMVTNTGLRHGPPAVIEQLSRGEVVDPSQYYFRSVPQFEAPLGSAYEWMNKSIFIGSAARGPAAALVKFYRVL